MMRIELAGGASAIAGQAAGAREAARLKDGAEQFEAMLLEQMLKPLQFGAGIDQGGDDAAAGGDGDTVRGFATEALARGLARGDGFGLARQIVQQVRREDRAVGTAQEGAKV